MIPIISNQMAIEKYGNNFFVILTIKDYEPILEQMRFIRNFESIEVYISEYLRQYNEEKEVHGIYCDEEKSDNQIIPKVINYFWIGGSKIPESNQKCIDSWKKLCPDYEIKKWDENNYDITKIKYMRQAYESKKWGFVPDYARLDIIYQNGGIYLDTDVEIVKSFDDLLCNEGFMGWESRYYVNAGSGFGACKKNEIVKEMMKIYESEEFIHKDGSLNLIASPHYQTKVLERHGLIKNGEYQIVDGMHIYPANYFSPKSFYTGINWKNENTFSIHHYDATWVKGQSKDDSIERHEKYNNMIDGIEIGYPIDDMNDLISVIIPVYNVEEYLERCIERVLAQTYKKLEIVLVDDGSTDDSLKICEKYCEKYENIKVVKKENGGLASARKAGLDSAQGEYIVCLDSDDYIDSDMLEYMHIRMIKANADVVFSNMIMEYEDETPNRIMKATLKAGIYNLDVEDNEVYRQFLVDDDGIGILHGICGKMIKADLYKRNQMNVPDEINRGEDAACMYPCLLDANCVVITDKYFYHYLQRKKSLLHKKNRGLLTNWEKLYYFLLDNCEFENEEMKKIFINNLEKFIMRRILLSLQEEFTLCIDNNNESKERVNSIVNAKVFSFPFSKVKKNSRIVIWGAGAVGKSYMQQVKYSNYCYMVSWVDSNVNNNEISAPTEIMNYAYDYIVIAVKDERIAKEIKKELKRMGIKSKKIIWERPTRYFLV